MAESLIFGARSLVLGRSEEPAGGWLAGPQGAPAEYNTRDRIGRHVSTTLEGAAGYDSAQTRQQRLLTADQLWLVYNRVPDVRAAVDAIVRRVATWDWFVEPTLDPSEEGYEEALNLATQAREFLKTPNNDGETWQEFWTKLVTDLVIFDAGASEVVFDSILQRDADGEIIIGDDGRPKIAGGENFEEFVVLRGPDIVPIIDQFGRTLGYKQDRYGTGIVFTDPGGLDALRGQLAGEPIFGPEQIVFFRMFPSTSTTTGQPLIETIVNEIITMMRQSEHSMLTFDADEIPPGILVITGVSGAAADAAKQDLKRLRGKDHKVRVVTSPDPNATGARWVELRHTQKDVDFVNVVMQIRRTIWRVFGVLPIEMGDTQDVPRSVGRVQLEVGASHLIGPILELIEGKVNARMLPQVVGVENKGLVTFKFDRESKLSATDQKAKSETLTGLVSNGILSRNEARKDLDLPPVAGGDTLTIDTPTGPIPLTNYVPTPEEVPEPGDDDPDEGNEEPIVTPEAIAEVNATVHRHTHDCAACAAKDTRAADALPSEWQARGKFDGVRTLSLQPLWEVTAEYTTEVRALYDDATAEVVSLVASTYKPGELDDQDATHLLNRLFQIMERLETQWAAATRRHYKRAAKIGRDSATDFTGRQVQDEWQQRADVYWSRAMGFLAQPGGLTYTVRAKLSALVAGLQSERSKLQTRQGQDAEIPAGVVATMPVADATAAASASFTTERFRITNWSGRLIELANSVFGDGMQEGSLSEVDNADEAGGPVWYVEWVNVGDARMCPTCTQLGSAGFVPMRNLPTVPGGQTECQANCRCVLVMWTEAEVNNGTAISLSGGAP